MAASQRPKFIDAYTSFRSLAGKSITQLPRASKYVYVVSFQVPANRSYRIVVRDDNRAGTGIESALFQKMPRHFRFDREVGGQKMNRNKKNKRRDADPHNLFHKIRRLNRPHTGNYEKNKAIQKKNGLPRMRVRAKIPESGPLSRQQDSDGNGEKSKIRIRSPPEPSVPHLYGNVIADFRQPKRDEYGKRRKTGKNVCGQFSPGT